MQQDVILKFLDGQSWDARLVHVFDPKKGEIDVHLGKSDLPQKFTFHELACIHMRPDEEDIAPFLRVRNPDTEEILMVTGTTYRVSVLPRMSFPQGFFGLSLTGDSPHKLIFFTTFGIKSRQQRRAVGEILQDKGILSADNVRIALEDQVKLKQRRVGEIIADHNALPRELVEKTIAKARLSGNLPPRVRVGDILIEAGLVTKEQVDEALTSQEAGKKKRIGSLLVDRGLITEDQLLIALATKFRLQMVNLDEIIPNKRAIESVSAEVAHRLKVFPVVDRGDCLVVATSQPTDHTIHDHLRLYTGRRIEIVVATSTQIEEAIERHYPPPDLGLGELLAGDAVNLESEIDEDEASGISETDSKIVTLVNKILLDGASKGASDIHFEPGTRDLPFQVRYRVDGICRMAHTIPPAYKRALLSRLKILANLDISERRKPQSGKIMLKGPSSRIEYRIEITPTAQNNEDAVLRVVSTAKPLPLNAMGFSEQNLRLFQNILAQSHGMVLCVGPTGSGKTTTLHSALSHINSPDRKIWTVEDPVEILQNGLRQVQVNYKIGLTFPEVLRSFLRADPDIIMVGEMRDMETAKTAIEASLTGHLVLSTLHTNNAAETIIRLVEMGMDPLSFADALVGILAQRLARKLCDCKQPYHPPEDEFASLVQLYEVEWYAEHGMPPYSAELMLMRKGGCDRCGGTGYKGRIAIHELAVASKPLKQAIKGRATAEEIRALAISEGMRTLQMDGVQKVFAGQTDLEQILRVCSSHTVSDVA